MNDPKPCPFCGAELLPNTNQNDMWVARYGQYFNHPPGHCVLADLEVSPSEVPAWNRRAPASDATPTPVVSSGALEAETATRATVDAPLGEQSSASLACGHPASLMLMSAETGEPLYCECCDLWDRKKDAETREAELGVEVARLKRVASIHTDALEAIANSHDWPANLGRWARDALDEAAAIAAAPPTADVPAKGEQQ